MITPKMAPITVLPPPLPTILANRSSRIERFFARLHLEEFQCLLIKMRTRSAPLIA